MRISDNRYSRDRFRLDLAFRFIRHEARTQTIRACGEEQLSSAPCQ